MQLGRSQLQRNVPKSAKQEAVDSQRFLSQNKKSVYTSVVKEKEKRSDAESFSPKVKHTDWFSTISTRYSNG